MTIYQYFKRTNNKEIYNKKIAYNILFSLYDLKLNDKNLKEILNIKISNLQKLHRFCDIQKIKNYVINNYNTYNGEIFINFKALDEKIK